MIVSDGGSRSGFSRAEAWLHLSYQALSSYLYATDKCGHLVMKIFFQSYI